MDKELMEKDYPEKDIVVVVPEGVIEEGQVVEEIVEIIVEPQAEIAAKMAAQPGGVTIQKRQSWLRL